MAGLISLLLKRPLPRVALLLLALSGQQPLANEPGHAEPAIKAAFVYNFAKFTRWPGLSSTPDGSPMRLCVSGHDAVTPELRHLTGKIVQGHPLVLQDFDAAPETSCDLLYVAASEQARYQTLLARVRGRPVLTVSEIPEFAANGGMIGLYLEAEHIRFAINQRSARAAGINFSARLLELAVLVDGEGQ